MPPYPLIDLTGTSAVNGISTEKVYWRGFSEQHTVGLSCTNQMAQCWMLLSDLAKVGVFPERLSLNTCSVFGSLMQLLHWLCVFRMPPVVNVFRICLWLSPLTDGVYDKVCVWWVFHVTCCVTSRHCRLLCTHAVPRIQLWRFMATHLDQLLPQSQEGWETICHVWRAAADQPMHL